LAICILHPYGVVGSLKEVPFGATRVNYVSLAAGIKTYTEQIAAGEIISEVANEFQRAQCIVFLGFAYHSQNMQILQPDVPLPTAPIYGTAYKMSDSDIDEIGSKLVGFFATNVSVENRRRNIKLENKLTCADLFDHYAKSLSGGD
jgi:hypothetical protein